MKELADIKLNENDNIIKTRTYNVSITYDRYYQTPKIWLSGSDEYGSPLSSDQIFEDIMPDYRRKTVSVEQHPFKSGLHVCIHPCKHANVMKKLINNLVKSSENSETQFQSLPEPSHYIEIFLKFIQSVIPGINYDYTGSVATC